MASLVAPVHLHCKYDEYEAHVQQHCAKHQKHHDNADSHSIENDFHYQYK